MKPYVFVLVLAAALLVGCELESSTPMQPTTPTPGSDDVQTFSSIEELEEFLSSSGGSSAGYAVNDFARQISAPMAESTADGAASADFGSTNVQEVGVDEADIFKTDGEFIYTASGSTLFVTSTGSDAQLLSRTGLNVSVQGLFVEDDTLVVIGSEQRSFGRGGIEPARSMIWPAPSSDMRVLVFDMSDREGPVQVKDVEFEGSYVDARLKEGVAYIISNSGISYDHPVPLLRVDGVERSIEPSRIAYFPGRYDDPQLTTVHALSLDSLELVSDGVLTERTQTVYMDEFLYLSSTRHVNEWEIRQEVTLDLGEEFLTSEDADLIARIRATDSDVLSSSEKEQKVLQVYYERFGGLSRSERESFEDEVDVEVKERLSAFVFREYTDVAKFSVSASGLSAVASGEVSGRVYDQFGFDEAPDGSLRVVTTTSGVWDDGSFARESENHVFSLDEDLSELDSVRGLAPGESVFSARFTDERLYLVTFEQVDPFFVIDVRDSSDLQVLGELKITGFSRYLHPVSDDVVLGLGREASETGRQQGLKVSLFDVSDVNDPQELTKWVSEDRFASSSAEFEHKAFLMNLDKELLVVPVSSYERDNQYQGAYVFRVTEDSLVLRGLVEHDSQVERSTWIADDLYTKSVDLLRVHRIEDLESLVDVELKQVSGVDVPVY